MFHLLTLGNAPYAPEDLSCTFLRGYEVNCRIGIHDFEREKSQRVLVDIALFTPKPQEEAGDDIGAVVDYDFLREDVARLCASRHFELQETLCREIAALSLKRPGVLGAAVSTRKPDVYENAEAVGCEVVRWNRPGFTPA